MDLQEADLFFVSQLAPPASGFRVQGVGFGAYGAGFRFFLGSSVKGLGFRV